MSACTVLAGPAGRALQQRGGVAEHDRVIVDVDDPAPRRDRLGDLVGIALVGSPVPMSRNWRRPASSARNLTARPRNARLARTPTSTLAPPAIIW
jgi:hypothetical protein